ncbi:MAG: hypothetical protein IJH86_10065 [Clostridia bacterium]|nr:hypothetical protein [Clostridia bacterium]
MKLLKILKKAALVAVPVIIIGGVVLNNITIIPTGYTGVRVKFGQVQQEPVRSGRVIVTLPFAEHVYTVNNKQQDYRIGNQIWGETDDKTPVYAADVTVTYQIAPERSSWIYANVSNYTNALVSEPLVASAVKSAMVELSPGDVTNRARIEPLIQQKLTEALAAKYDEGTVVINKVVVGNMDFEPAYNEAIQAKSIAAQAQARATIENQTAIARAEADKKVALLKAEADAEKVRIAAQAEAEANRLIQQSLTPELIEMKKIDAWDGKLPTVMGSNTLMGLGVLDEQ